MRKILFYTIFTSNFLLNGCGGKNLSSFFIPSPSPDISANQILESIYALCEQPGYNELHPFCLTHNLRNTRQILKPYLHKIKDSHSTDQISYIINEILSQDLKLSHFCLLKDTTQENSNLPFGRKFALNNPSKSYIHRNHVELKITDFDKNFNWYELQRGLDHALTYQKGIVIDLRENPGGVLDNLNQLFSYFFPSNTVISHTITRKHEPYLGSLDSWIGNYSKFKMKNLINTIQSNWNSRGNPWEINSFYQYSTIQKNIAILINENSASCSEYFTMCLREYFPHRVKIIGKKSAGALLASRYLIIPHLGLKIQYPTAEIIGTHGTRVEGIGIEPDERAFTSTDAISIAKEWVDH